MESSIESLTDPLSKFDWTQFYELGANFGLKLITALAIFVIGRWIARWISRVLEKGMNKAGTEHTLVVFLRNIVYVGLMVMVILAAVGQLGIQTTSFLAVLGAAGLAVGLALQGSLANFAAGVLIILFRPFKVGDFIEAGGVAGVVKAISIFTTTLHTGDNKAIIIPNAQVNSGTITNFSANETRRVDLVIGVSYSDDLDKVRSIIEGILAADERVLKDPAPTVAVMALADSSVNFTVRPWANAGDYWGLYFDLQEQIKKSFDKEGISIPFPQRDVYVHQVSS
ncbi:MAG: mechanosensitive ion channel domain-containing protein [Gammaproteobacteria bacterium]